VKALTIFHQLLSYW